MQIQRPRKKPKAKKKGTSGDILNRSAFDSFKRYESFVRNMNIICVWQRSTYRSFLREKKKYERTTKKNE